MFASIIPGNIKGMTEEISNARIFQLHQNLSYKPYSISFTPTCMCVDLMYDSNGILDINENILMLTLGPQCKETKSPIVTKQI